MLFASSKLYYSIHSIYIKCEDNGKMNTNEVMKNTSRRIKWSLSYTEDQIVW